MRTMYDYIKIYGNVSLKDSPWNGVDCLLCSIVPYFPIKPFEEERSLEDICYEVAKMDIPNDHWYDAKKTRELAAFIVRCKRYKGIMFSHFENRVDQKTQFGAVTIKVGKTKIISFEGSDGSAIGWAENLRLSYLYPSFSQKLALKYAKKVMDEDDSDIILLGHSKGGNMAMSVGMELNEEEFKRIKKIYNFDGPGFLKEQYETQKYLRMQTKLITVMPQTSYIGCLMHNDGGTRYVVKTNTTGIAVHFVNRWEIFGTTFINVPIDKRTVYFNRITSYGFDNLDREESGKFIEVVFKKLLENYKAMVKVDGKALMAVFNDAKKENIKLSRVFGRILLLLFAYSKLGSKFRKKDSKKDTIEIEQEADKFMERKESE